jgi:uncharacterized protein YvpB
MVAKEIKAFFKNSSWANHMLSNRECVKLDVPLVHSQAQYCHIDSLSMILRRIGDAYEAWYMGPVSGQFFGLGYFAKPSFVKLSFGTYPLDCLLTFLEEHGYAYQYDEGKSWEGAFAALKAFLKKNTPVLIISHMGWLSYNKEYEIMRRVGGVVDHYVVITGYRDDEVVYVNDPHPDWHKKDAELPVSDFRVGWTEKLKEIQSMRCPMLVVNGRKSKPDTKKVLKRALHRALRNLNTKRGGRGIAGLRKASREIPKLLRNNDPSIRNSLGDWAFFTFRVSENNRKDISKFLSYAATELDLEKLREACSPLVCASECYADLRRIFRETLESGIPASQAADEVEALLCRAYENERQWVQLVNEVLSTRP